MHISLGTVDKTKKNGIMIHIQSDLNGNNSSCVYCVWGRARSVNSKKGKIELIAIKCHLIDCAWMWRRRNKKYGRNINMRGWMSGNIQTGKLHLTTRKG